MKSKINDRYLMSAAINLMLLVVILIFSTGMAAAQGNSPKPGAHVTSVQEVNPFYTIKSLALSDGAHFIAQIIKSPPTPPGGLAAEQASTVSPMPAGVLILSEVPAFKWVMGCSAVSGSMVSGYYDRTGYDNIYTGPTNGGVYPLVEDDLWGNWTDVAGTTYPNNPLIASHNGLDGRMTRGSIDDYWVSYGSAANDPYITGGWTQHTWETAIGDYMKTSQLAYGNTDGATTFYGYNAATKLTCSAMEGYGVSQDDGTYGRKLFYEARGYTVTDCYAQATDNKFRGGFSLANFKAEIDAGRPVFLNLAGHSIVGVGYDPSSTTIYVHDTWDNSTHSMVWGGSYSGMVLQSVSIVNLAPTGTGVPSAFNKTSPANAATGQATSLSLTWNATSPVTSYDYCYSTSTGCTNWTNVGNTTHVTISGLSYSTPYYWQVRAWNGSSGPTTADGDTYWSFTTQAAPPAPPVPTGVSATKGTYPDKVQISWNTSAGATDYQVYRNTSNSSSGAALLGSPSASPYDDTSAAAGTTYWYFVKACNSAMCSDFSSPDSGFRAVDSLPGTFNKTFPANGSSILASTVTLTWSTSLGATSYSYCFSTSRKSCSTWTSVGDATSVTRSNLKRRTTYYWHVQAINGFGNTYSNGSSTAFWSFRTK